jgi:hypothetical protein
MAIEFEIKGANRSNDNIFPLKIKQEKSFRN